MEFLHENNIKAVLPSIRIDHITADDLDIISDLGQKMITVAPESFIENKRCVLGKYCNKDVMPMLRKIIDEGFDLKLYILAGIKGLENRDLEEINQIRELGRYARQKGRKITVSLNPLIPKPRTPFQWIGMADKSVIVSVLKKFRRELKRTVDLRDYDIRWAIIQAAIALGGKDISEVLLRTAVYGGGLSAWRRALRETSYNIAYVFKGYPLDEELPWSRIDIYRDLNSVNRSRYEVIRQML